MTNPNNAIGVNAAYGTRTSVNAMNDLAQIVSGRGILSGWAVVPKTGMTVSAGGVAGTRDVAIGEDNLGNRICLNNRLASSVDVTIPAASASSARYDAIVVYANNPAQAEDTTPDAPGVCGIIVASGSASGVSDAQIRSAITADGGTGSTAYYAVLAQVYVGAGSTVITSANISQSKIGAEPGEGSITTAKIADGVITTDKVANNAITKEKISDTGWIEVAYTSGYAAPGESTLLGALRMRVLGGVVYAQGGVGATDGGNMPSGESVVAKIPDAILSAVASDSPLGTTIGRMSGGGTSSWSYNWATGAIYCAKTAVPWAGCSAAFALA